MKREEEINLLCKHLVKVWNAGANRNLEALFEQAVHWADEHPKNPWITDRDPEIRGSISDAVLLLIDGMFYRVSRLERRKDGSEFWWGVDVANGEEVTAWMPIPSVEGGEQ